MFLRTIWVCCLERTEYGEVKTTDQNHRIVLQTEPRRRIQRGQRFDPDAENAAGTVFQGTGIHQLRVFRGRRVFGNQLQSPGFPADAISAWRFLPRLEGKPADDTAAANISVMAAKNAPPTTLL